MGTSLSGLTPATTFDGLLKTSDNDSIGTGLKTIGTGDGTDSVLQLSDSQLNVAGQFSVDTDTSLNTMNLRGDSLVINQIYQANETTYNSIAMANSAGIQFKNLTNTTAVIRSNKFGLGIGGSTDPLATAHIKGSGATSATTSLLVQNSAGSELFKLTDDGNINLGEPGTSPIISSGRNSGKSLKLGNQAHLSSFDIIDFKTWDGATAYTEVMRITGNSDQFVGIGETTPTARLHVKGSGNDNTTTSLLVQNSDGIDMFKVLNGGATRINTETLSSTIIGKNGTGGAFVVDAGKVDNIRADVNGVAINSTPSANISFKVKGSGATSATTALLVQNSAGTELFKVQDDGATTLNGFTTIDVGNGDPAANNGLYFGNGKIKISNYFNQGILNVPTGRLKLMSSEGVSIGTNYQNTQLTAMLSVKGLGNDATTTALLVQNSDGADMLKVGDDGILDLGDTGAKGEITLGRSSDGAQMGNIFANGNGLAIRGNGGYNTIMVGRNSNEGVTINNGTAYLGASLAVKGFGATSATTALLVENSAGTELLKVLDGGTDKQVRMNSAQIGSISVVGTRVEVGTGVKTIFKSSGMAVNENYSAANSSAQLDVSSTTKGFLPPRMTTTERDAISTPAAGLMVYNTTTNKAQCYNGTAWQDLF